MRAFLTTLFLSLAASVAAPAWSGEDIRAVLQRSQQMQLDALGQSEVDASDPRAAVVHASFERVLTAVDAPPDTRLIVVEGPLLAVCLMGRVIAANVALADLSEAERSFVLGHEVGHVVYRHWAQLGELYERHIPGEVVKEKTDAVAFPLSREASALAHQHEFEADGFALRLMRRLGDPEDTPVVLFQQHLPLVQATATHPGTFQRLSQLRLLQ